MYDGNYCRWSFYLLRGLSILMTVQYQLLIGELDHPVTPISYHCCREGSHLTVYYFSAAQVTYWMLDQRGQRLGANLARLSKFMSTLITLANHAYVCMHMIETIMQHESTRLKGREEVLSTYTGQCVIRIGVKCGNTSLVSHNSVVPSSAPKVWSHRHTIIST